ncbi:hypothetical protein T492DRAFT_1098894, partial [Pavlovales sp. CCMP2436]
LLLVILIALERVRKQASLAPLYKIERISDDDDVPISQCESRVTCVAPPQAAPQAVGSSSAEGRKAGAAVGSGPLPGVLDPVDNAVLLADHGLNQQWCSVTHVASLRKCTCQQPNCSGLPCRHQLAIWNYLLATHDMSEIHSLAFNIKNTITPVWLKESHDVLAVAAAVRQQQRDIFHANMAGRRHG